MEFPELPAGDHELVLSQSSSVASTVPAPSDELPTEPEEEFELISVDSSSEAEILSVKLATKLPSIELEQKLMAEHERYGHFYRVQDRHKVEQERLRAEEERVRRIRAEIAAESPESKRTRRARFREVVYGMRS